MDPTSENPASPEPGNPSPNPDLSPLLKGWPFQPGEINARFITGEDGETKIQVRVDLGILQMNTTGRPDGERPEGFESLLEYHEARFDDAEQDQEDPPKLTSDECQELRDEAVQYYHRYVALLTLEDFQGVVRDTTRNLRVLDLCAKHAESAEDRGVLEQFRPYITMVRARAMASQALKDNEPKAALLAIDEALDALKLHFQEQGQPQAFESSNEVQMLRGMRESLVPKLPVSQVAELRSRLAKAIELENYELAAILRDELRQISKE